jgi:hypothetical protein
VDIKTKPATFTSRLSIPDDQVGIWYRRELVSHRRLWRSRGFELPGQL